MGLSNPQNKGAPGGLRGRLLRLRGLGGSVVLGVPVNEEDEHRDVTREE